MDTRARTATINVAAEGLGGSSSKQPAASLPPPPGCQRGFPLVVRVCVQDSPRGIIPSPKAWLVMGARAGVSNKPTQEVAPTGKRGEGGSPPTLGGPGPLGERRWVPGSSRSGEEKGVRGGACGVGGVGIRGSG